MTELKLNEKGETGCCPRFNPEPWDDKTYHWENKKFIKAKVRTFFYIPLNFGKVIAPLAEKIDKAGANDEARLCLSDHTSRWNMDIYVAVGKDVADEEMAEMSGEFYSKVYEGDFKETGKWCKDFEESAKAKNYNIKKLYMCYTTCPACAKAYGKNYVVVIGEIK